MESPVGNDNEVVKPGRALNDRFHQSSFDGLGEGNSEEGVNKQIGLDQIVSLACPRLNHVRRESVRSTFHGRRGSVVALDVLHRDRQGADSKNKEEISSMCVCDLLDRLDLPKEDEERNGKGMVPSASYNQLHGQLGFGKTITVSEKYRDNAVACQKYRDNVVACQKYHDNVVACQKYHDNVAACQKYHDVVACQTSVSEHVAVSSYFVCVVGQPVCARTHTYVCAYTYTCTYLRAIKS